MQDETLHRIRLALAEVWETGGRRFATFEDAEDDGLFVQYLDGQLNVAWPFDADPRTELPRRGVRLPGRAYVVGWAPRLTLHVAAGDLLLDDVARLVDELLDEVLEVDDVVCRVDDDR